MKTSCWIFVVVVTTSVSLGEDEAGKAVLTTPKSVFLSYRDAVSRRDWHTAENCLASDLRKMLKDVIADRTFFDQYVVSGFATKTSELLPANATEKGMADLEGLERMPHVPGPGPRCASAIVASGGGVCPWVARCWFVEQKDGWKLTVGPQGIKKKEDFLDWYERAISRESRGRARELERKPFEQPTPQTR